MRARIVLACAEGDGKAPVLAVAARPGLNRGRPARCLSDDPRPGVPCRISDTQVEDVVVKTLEEVPDGATHWSRYQMAAAVGLSPSTIGRIWHAFGLKPHATEDFEISTDPLLIDKVRDVFGL
ncbi:hypothetical protein ABH935_009856 [Catenulispora sp. GAS73]